MSEPLKWFRLYTCWLDDPQLKSLSRPVRMTHLELLCLKALGQIPAPDAYVGKRLGVRRDAVGKHLVILRSHRLLTEDNDIPTWEARQPRVDHSGSERQRRHREKVATAGFLKKSDVTGDVIEKSREEKSREEKKEKIKREREAPPSPPKVGALQLWAIEVTKEWNELVESSKNRHGSLTPYLRSKTILRSIAKRGKKDPAFREECIPQIRRLKDVGVNEWHLGTRQNLGQFINGNGFPQACAGGWDAKPEPPDPREDLYSCFGQEAPK